MAKYRNIGGPHYEPPFEGKLPAKHPYVKGDVIETNRDLCLLYPNHFDKITEEQPSEPVSTERRAAVQELIDNEVWHEDDRNFLEQLREKDFARVTRQVAAPSMEGAEQPKKKGKASLLGEEVTDSFQQAYDEGYHVFINPQGMYQVTKGNAKKPLNEEPLERDAVEDFVSEHLKG